MVRVLSALLLLFMTSGMMLWRAGALEPAAYLRRVYLLVPDDLPRAPDSTEGRKDESYLRLWTQAAREQGFEIKVLTDSQFLRPEFVASERASGIIVPDEIHQRANPALTETLKEFVREGGKLLLVYDALTLNSSGVYPPFARMRDAVGVDYALYERLGPSTIKLAGAEVTTEWAHRLGLPPGSYSDPEWERPSNAAPDARHTLNGYEVHERVFAHFATQGPFEGTPLLRDPSGDLLAGIHDYGKGRVLFANLPLGYLKMRTDGVLLHSFLRLFTEKLLASPVLLSTPEGRGGLVMNLHVDSNVALKPLARLKKLGLFTQGPYSVHITAGPDTYRPGDHAGFDLPHNPVAQDWVRFFINRGDAVGSHGGWIHDYFGLNANEGNRDQFVQYLALNKEALEKAGGLPVTEYSAPVGNQPLWVTDWLAQHGFVAYYFTGNMGMGPTESFRGPEHSDQGLWSFPVMPYGEAASFEEFRKLHVPERDVASWLKAVSRFSVESHSVRLVYFHPPGLLFYPRALTEWLATTRELTRDQGFRWYTLTGLARFDERRKHTRWEESVTKDLKISRIHAWTDANLLGETWQLPKARYARPEPVRGAMRVADDGDHWLVVSGAQKEMEFRSKLKEERSWPYYLAWVPDLKSSR